MMAVHALLVVAVSTCVSGVGAQPLPLSRKTLVEFTKPALLGSAAIGSPAFSPDGRHLAYVSVDFRTASGVYTLWIADADGTHRRLLANNAREPVWSPDSTRIAYVTAGPSFPHEMWIVHPDGSGAAALARDAWSAPAWSPDGRKLAYLGSGPRQGLRSVRVMDPDGDHNRRLFTSSDNFLWFEWCPDSRRLCVEEHLGRERPYGPRRAFVIKVESQAPVRIEPPLAGADVGRSSFSPDGRYFALVCYGPAKEVWRISPGETVERPRVSVWLKDQRAGAWQRLASRKALSASLHWSPRGDRLAVGMADDSPCDTIGVFALWRATGRQLSPWQKGTHVRWSPDGRHLVYHVHGDGHGGNVMVCDNAGKRATPICEYDDLLGGLSWSPEGRALAVVAPHEKTRPLELVTFRK